MAMNSVQATQIVSEKANSDEILSLENIRKSFDQGSERLDILKGVSLSIREGEMVALLGPSGSGKSTLLQIVGLLDKADQGDIRIDGQSIKTASESDRTRLRRFNIGFVYQFHHLLPEFSALENLIIPQMIQGVSHKQASGKAKEFLKEVGLDHREDHRPARLSGGEQQRVALARALVNEPKLLLADEPTGNLDPVTSESIFTMLEKIVRHQKVGCLLATHNVDLARQMDRIVEIKDGVLVDVEI